MPESSGAFPFERIAAACREHKVREKILVAPSLAIGHQIGDRIAREGTPWINLRVETIRTLADAVTAAELAAEGITLLSRAQALALVEAACAEALGATSYFAALADRPGLHRAVQRSIDDLRLAGASAASLQSRDFEDPLKGDDLRKILGAYEHALEQGRFIDRAGVTLRAVRHLEGGGARPWPADALWIVVDEEERAAAEARVVELSIGNASVHPAGQPEAAMVSYHFVRAAGEENELRAAFRAILASGRELDQAELAYATREVYLPLAWELTSEYGIPSTFAEGIAAHFTRPGKAAVELLRWIESWEDVHLRRAGQAGVLDVEAPLTAAGFARILREAAIGWGRERHRTRLAALEAERVSTLEAKTLEGEDEPWMAEQIERTRAARDVMESLLDLAPAEETLPIGQLASSLASLVDARAAVRSEIDGMAKSALCGMLRELAAVPGEPLAKAEACDRLREAVLALHVGASNPRPGHLHVAPIRAAGWCGRPLLFVAGLEESRYPGSGTQDPILLDAERGRLNEALDPHRLPLFGDRPRRVTEEFRRLLTRSPHGAEVVLSWPALDLRERKEKFPSQVLLEVFRAQKPAPGGEPEPGYDALVAAATPAGFIPDEQPLSMSEWWLRASFGGGVRRRDLGDAPLRAHPWLAEGRRAEEARASAEITKWDGKIEAPAEELDPRHQERPYSASRLERMATCPYGYFLQSILGIEPLECVDRSEEWLSPMEYGSVFHKVLERFMREICSRGEKPGLAVHTPRLEAIALEELQATAETIPPPSESALQARKEDLLRSCGVFLRQEEKRCGEIDAKYFEVPFGFEDAEGELAMAEPLEIPLAGGTKIKLRGKIDRVDHHPERDRWHVWDYKSGSTFKYKQGGSLAGGTMIQHAIYARAVNEMLARRGEPGRVEKSGYYFPTTKGKGLLIEKLADQDSLETALNHLCDLFGSGWFPQGDLDRCKFCDFPSICLKSKESVAAQDAKSDAAAGDPGAEAWAALRKVT